MRRLVLLRHAKSDHPPGVTDHDRPLTERGRRDAARVGEAFRSRGLSFDRIIVSSSVRTRETVSLLGLSREPDVSAQIYEAAPDAILSVLRATAPEVSTLLAVGHNPGFELTAHFLARVSDRARLNSVGEKFPTAAFAILDFEMEWREIGEGKGALAAFLRPSDL